MIRRLVDILVAVVALLLTGPLVLLLALAVRMESSGGAFYGGSRVGKHGRLFNLWKLRSMVSNADQVGPSITARDDPRITRIGALLRGARLDELPQFWNLLTGDVTLIGPRAEDPKIFERYTAEQQWILSVRPGLTGPGTLFYAMHQEDSLPTSERAEEYYLRQLLDRKLRIDREYLARRTVGSDLGVLLRTASYAISELFGHRASKSDGRP